VALMRQRPSNGHTCPSTAQGDMAVGSLVSDRCYTRFCQRIGWESAPCSTPRTITRLKLYRTVSGY
jgi:hypothetical protein